MNWANTSARWDEKHLSLDLVLVHLVLEVWLYFMTHTVSIIGMQGIIWSFPVPGLDNFTGLIALGNRKLAGANSITVPRLAKGQFEITKYLLVCGYTPAQRNCWGVYWFHSVRPSIPPPVRPSVRHPVSALQHLQFGLDNFIFIHLIRQLQKVCHV